MTSGLFVNLTATGRSPLSSQIKTIITVELYEGSSFDVQTEDIASLENERLALTRLCERLSMRTLVYNNSFALNYLMECCAEYGIKPEPSDVRPLCDCMEELIDMGLDIGSCMAGIPRYTGELKHFYKDYKNYYYLPAEDQAYHKSVSGFVDRSARVQATARTAYTKKTGTFIPVYDVSMIDPNVLFSKDYGSGVFYTLPQYLDLNNLKVISSYMFCPHKHPDA